MVGQWTRALGVGGMPLRDGRFWNGLRYACFPELSLHILMRDLGYVHETSLRTEWRTCRRWDSYLPASCIISSCDCAFGIYGDSRSLILWRTRLF